MTFAEKVYEAVTRIPEGRVATYGQIAELIGCPGGSRAVGNALHVNPFAPRDRFSEKYSPAWHYSEQGEQVGKSANEGAAEQGGKAGKGKRKTSPMPGAVTHAVVPCHRVVAADGSLAEHFGCGGAHVQYERLKAEGVTFLGGGKSRVDLARCGIVIERHPLEPFLPANATTLFLGSFPPPQARWCMEFFYPNWINDFWRIQGLVHFGDAHWFEDRGEQKRFDKSRIVEFCQAEGLAFYDTAVKVCRWRGNASDEFLEILEPVDLEELLAQMPECQTIVSTGGKSCEELANILAAGGREYPRPQVGASVEIALAGRTLRWWRMPSSSRAYPMSLKAKAEQYAKLL